jgi:serralysin
LDGALDFEQTSFYELDVSAWDGKGGISRSHVRVTVADVIGETSTARLGGAKVLGNKGRDQLNGNIDNDTLGGGSENDTLTGGAGRDTFLFDTAPGKTNVDRIMDFKPREDHIQLDDGIFRKVGKVGVLKKGAFWTGDKAHDRDDRIIYNKKTGALYYDADGNGNGAAVKFAELSKKLALKHADFLIA